MCEQPDDDLQRNYDTRALKIRVKKNVVWEAEPSVLPLTRLPTLQSTNETSPRAGGPILEGDRARPLFVEGR